MMRYAKWIALLGALAQGSILIYGFTQGNFSAAGSFFLHDPWGIVSLVDVYVGFLFFCAWIFYREEKWWAAALWSLAILILGNFTAGVYAYLALQTSGEDWKKFWMGHHQEVA